MEIGENQYMGSIQPGHASLLIFESIGKSVLFK